MHKALWQVNCFKDQKGVYNMEMLILGNTMLKIVQLIFNMKVGDCHVRSAGLSFEVETTK